VKRSFVQQALRMKGFNLKWCNWIDQCVYRESVGIRVNDDIGHHFQMFKGVKTRTTPYLLFFLLFSWISLVPILIAAKWEYGKVETHPSSSRGSCPFLQYAMT
jgi:hypothetical protein